MKPTVKGTDLVVRAMDPELMRGVRVAAAERNITIKAYVEGVLRAALKQKGGK